MNVTSTRTLVGFRSENATEGSSERTKKTDSIWFFNTNERNSSKLVNTAAFTDLKHSNASSVLYLTKPRDEPGPTQSQAPNDIKPNRQTENRHTSTTGVNVPRILNQKTEPTFPVRDWRRTLQVMPRMEDYLHTWPKSKTVSSHDPMARTSYSMIHEIKSKSHDSDSAVTNMDMQGNRRSSLGYKINTPVNQEDG